MSQHAMTGSAARRARQSRDDLVAWHDSRTRATMSSPRGWLWAAVVAASFFWMSNPLVFVRIFDDSVRYTVICTAIAAVLTLPWLRLPRVPWPWLLFLVLCLLSQLWTIDDASTDTAVHLYLTMTALAVVVAASCEAEVVAWGMALGGVVVVALSVYAYEKTMWGSSYLTWQGTIFAGVGTNENILAYTLAVSLGATVALLRRRHWAVQACWALVLVANAYGLYLAESGTGYLASIALVVTQASIMAWPALRRAGRRVGLLWASTATAVVLTSLGVVASLLGKQLSTVSGRSPFWVAAIESTLDRAPVLGSGWGAVWERPWVPATPNDVAAEIYARAGLALAHGHNFFIDVLPELGLVGIGVALAMVAYAVREVARRGLQAGADAPAAGRLVLMVLVALLVSGVSEPMLTVPLGWWSLTLVVTLSRQPVRARTSRTTGRRRSEPGDDVDPRPVPVAQSS